MQNFRGRDMPLNPLAKRMSLRDMQISKSEKKFLAPLFPNPGYTPGLTMYHGRETGIVADYKHCVLSGSMIITALESVEKNVNCEICFINYLNNIYSVSCLKEVAVFVS